MVSQRSTHCQLARCFKTPIGRFQIRLASAEECGESVWQTETHVALIRASAYMAHCSCTVGAASQNARPYDPPTSTGRYLLGMCDFTAHRLLINVDESRNLARELSVFQAGCEDQRCF